ncbi:hypothetical protein KR084_001484, partial [Drosophila pseudotakahashii]
LFFYSQGSNMSDGVSILHIKQEVDTSSAGGGAPCFSPSSKSTATQSGANGMKSSPSVSPERQLCSSTTSLSCDLHNVSLSNDGDSLKGGGAGSGTSGGGGGGGGGGNSGGNASNASAGTGSGSVRDELRRLCLVCGDVASGFHYGVASCEACKAFFKRTIQGNIEYTCPANNECEINKRRRKACQACRFQKCLLMGMLKEGVRLDRVRGGRQKYRRNPVSNSYQTMQLLYQSNTTSLCDVKILEVLNSYEPDALSVQTPPPQVHTTTIANDEASSSSGSIKLESSVGVTPNGTCIFQNNNNNDPNEILSVLSDIYDKELVSVIGWAKQIPGFIELPLNDQMKLLQVSWAEILTLQLTFRSLPFNGKLCFATDVWMDELLAKECGYTDFYYHCVQIAQRMERISPRREEYYLLKALLLANCDILLDDQSSLRAFRDTILNSLNDVVYLLRHSSAVSHQQQLLLLLPSLRQADDILRRFWRGIARDEVITMKKLFLEMLEPLAR